MSDPARTFLARTMPWAENGATAFFNIQWTTPDKKWRSRAFQSLDDAVKTLNWLKQQDNVRDLYACMSSQRVATPKQTANGTTYYWGERSLAGAVELKSLFLDVDVKEKGYATTDAAIAALGKFMGDSGMPRPTIIVSTGGGGFHCHWCLDRNLKPEEWKPLAQALVNCCKHFGFNIDPGIATDAARILRIPDTTNYKYDPPRQVQLGGAVLANDYQVEYIAEKLLAYMSPAAPGPTPGVGATIHNLNTDELGAGIGQQAAFVFAEFRSAIEFLDAQSPSPFATGSYEGIRDLMFACVFVELTYPFDRDEARKLFGEVVARNGRNPEDNSKRYQAAVTGTAEKLKKGLEVVRPATFFKQAIDKGWSPPKPDPGVPDPDLPPGYTRQEDGTIWVTKTDPKLGLSRLVSVASYPMENAWISKDPLALNFVTKIRGKNRTITIAHEKAARKENVAPTLSGQGFIVKPLQSADVQEFILAWITHLQNTRKTSNAAAFGWTDGGFAYGGQIHNGTNKAPAGAADANTLRQYEPCGSLQVWIDTARVITDQKRPALDAILASAFAGPLIKLLGHDGMLVSAFSPESGIGKSTALRVAQAVWGHPIEAAQVLSDTLNSVVGKLGEVRNLPLYWDEIKSETQVEKFVDLAFQLSTGREKGRMTQNAVQRKSGTWETLLMSCSNDSIVESIASSTPTSSAGVYRCFEFQVPPAMVPSPLSQPTVSTMVSKLKSNFGQAGLFYAAYLGGNEAQIETQLLALNERLVIKTRAGKDERFWIASITALMAGAMYANQLGLTQIDLNALLDFLLAELSKQRQGYGLQSTMIHQSRNLADVLSMFLRDMRGRFTLHTNRIHRAPGRPVVGTILVRYHVANLISVKVQIGLDDRVMRVLATDFNEWLREKKLPTQIYHTELKNQFGMIHVLGALGSGTDFATGQARCLEFDLSHPSMKGYFDSL